jgi:hypothetical protein
MTIPQSVRRATLNGAGLALLASLACATPAAAQSLNVADTLAYINQRCGEHLGSDSRYYQSVSLHRNKLAIVQWRPPLHDGRPGTLGGSYQYNVGVFDIRATYIHETPGAIFFPCGSLDCVSTAQIHRRSALQLPGGPLEATDAVRSGYSSASLESCREQDRVFNAFKHLQELVGGRIADPVDPFAN